MKPRIATAALLIAGLPACDPDMMAGEGPETRAVQAEMEEEDRGAGPDLELTSDDEAPELESGEALPLPQPRPLPVPIPGAEPERDPGDTTGDGLSRKSSPIVNLDRVHYCRNTIPCNSSLSYPEYAAWDAAGVANDDKRKTTIGRVSEPAVADTKNLVFITAGQQFEFGLFGEKGTSSSLTGQPTDWMKDWSNKTKSKAFALNSNSLVARMLDEGYVDPADTYIGIAFDARFNHLFSSAKKQEIEDAYYNWLKSRFTRGNIETIYLAGHSRGGCLVMRLGKRFNAEFPEVPVIVHSMDGVCKKTQGELGIAGEDVDNPMSTDSDVWGWATNLENQFAREDGQLSVQAYVGGREFLIGPDVNVRAFSHEAATSQYTDRCWYRQEWRNWGHMSLGTSSTVVDWMLGGFEDARDDFDSPRSCRLMEQSHHLLTGDFDGDGDDDLLYVPRQSYGRAYLRRSSGFGSFYAAEDVTEDFGMSGAHWATAYRVPHVGDFNGDGADDLLLRTRSGNHDTFLLTSDGSGGFNGVETVTNRYWMSTGKWSNQYREGHVADYNGDGHDDILLINRAASGHATYMLFADPGTGEFRHEENLTNRYWMSEAKWATAYRVPHIGDFNGDGAADILLRTRYGGHGTYLIRSNGSGDFLHEEHVTNRYWMSAGKWSAQYRDGFVGDFDGDGYDDIILINKTGSGHATYLLRANGFGEFDHEENLTNASWMSEGKWATAYRQPVVGDFDGDSRDDLLLQSRSGGHATYLLRGLAGGGFFHEENLTNAFGMTEARWHRNRRRLVVGNFRVGGGTDLVLQGSSFLEPSYRVSANNGSYPYFYSVSSL